MQRGENKAWPLDPAGMSLHFSMHRRVREEMEDFYLSCLFRRQSKFYVS